MKEKMREFICNRCGKCCEKLNLSPLYDDLHDGSGICRYFNRKTRLCTIYKRRPIKCNIKLSYKKVYKRTMGYDLYIKINYEACDKI